MVILYLWVVFNEFPYCSYVISQRFWFCYHHGTTTVSCNLALPKFKHYSLVKINTLIIKLKNVCSNLMGCAPLHKRETTLRLSCRVHWIGLAVGNDAGEVTISHTYISYRLISCEGYYWMICLCSFNLSVQKA